MPALNKGLDTVNQNSAKSMVSRAKALAPKIEGELIQSIRSRKSRGAFIVEAGGETTTKRTPSGSYDYALGVEFGNSRRPAQPFFWPSYRATKRGHRKEAVKVLNRTIKNAGF